MGSFGVGRLGAGHEGGEECGLLDWLERSDNIAGGEEAGAGVGGLHRCCTDEGNCIKQPREFQVPMHSCHLRHSICVTSAKSHPAVLQIVIVPILQINKPSLRDEVVLPRV